jgi:predicted ATPase
MIQSIELKNFKSIKNKYFPLRNLSVLLGLNGQGKSSFVQSLLLLRQSDKLAKGQLKLNGGKDGLVNIGTQRDAYYQFDNDNKTKEMSISLKFKDKDVYKMDFDYNQFDSDIFQQKNISESFFAQNEVEPLFTDNFHYLNAQRIEPTYLNLASVSNVINDNLGKQGQYTAHYIELKGNEIVAFDNLVHPNSSNYEQIGNEKVLMSIDKTLRNQINLWLGEISPGVNVLTNKISSDFVSLEYSFKQNTLGDNTKFKPENVGFGISYALHVVTVLLSAKPDTLIIIENPESHIHPRGQAELGKLIARVSQNDVQIIIETHSDHILNGIRVAVKENVIDKNKVIGFYFKKASNEMEQYSKITNIEIDKNGELSDYPEGLLDEWSNQLLKLL